MRFASTHKLTSYLMALAALAAVASTGTLSTAALVVTGLAIAASALRDPPRDPPRSTARLWNGATVLCFLLVIADIARNGSPLEDGVYFLLFLLVNKLFNRRASRDYQQAYIITFLLLVAGTALAANVVFLAAFAAYTLFATWSLILFNLRRDMEENYLFKHSDDEQSERVEIQRILNSRRVVGKLFLAGTGAVATGVLFAAAVFFVLFPRVGFGFLGLQGGRTVSMAGFGSEVRLDQNGLIQPNPTVVLRIAFPDGFARVDVATLHFRGVAFEAYRDGVWSHGPDDEPPLAYRSFEQVWYGRTTPPHGDFADPFPGALTQDVQLEALDTPTVFAASQILGVRPESRTDDAPLYSHQDEIEIPHSAALHYRAWSDVRSPSPTLLAASPPPDPAELARYLELPSDLPVEIRALGRRLTDGAPTEYAKVEAVARYLRTGYRYTLDIRPTPGVRDPLDDFLFHRRSGHCEFFATALAVLLRAGGVPTRTVDGFLGGEWNGYGHYLAVREGDAHSWVEVYFPSAGWVTFDATPPGPPLLATSGFLETLRQLFDDVDYAFYDLVLRYDLDRQFRLVHRLLDRLAGHRGRSGRWLGDLKRTPRQLLEGIGLVAIVLAAAFALARRRSILAWIARWRRRGSTAATGHARHAEAEPLRRLLASTARRLAPKGAPWRPSDTPRQYAASLVARKLPEAPVVGDLVELYYTVRFGDAPLSATAVRHLSRRLRSARRAEGASAE